MPISVVVGGQFGSEGKGKVALDLVRRDSSITTVVRPGGTNSGHTGYARDGEQIILRQLPAAAIDGQVNVVLPAGSYIDVELLAREIESLSLPREQVIIDPRAHVIRPEHVEWEQRAGLARSIGSTGSGTGAAVISRLARFAPHIPVALPATDVAQLQPYISDTTPILRAALHNGERILIEGTQGFGLSPLHGDAWPKSTSRDTTAAAFVSEAGLSPLDVDQIVLVLRTYPIRVAGDSGPLPEETTWEEIARNAGAPINIQEFTSVTKKLRRVGRFSAGVVRRAIAANSPTEIVMNHLDYVDWACRTAMTPEAMRFVVRVQEEIGRNIDWVGLSPKGMQRSEQTTIAQAN